jgi:hypothetical protein
MNAPPRPGRSVAALLSRHGLHDVEWRPLVHMGYSGSTLMTCRDRAGRSWVLKRSSLRKDWIMRATRDRHGREYRLATEDKPPWEAIRSAAVDGARSRSDFYVLMVDISDHMPTGQLARADVEAIVARMVELHVQPIIGRSDYGCSLEDRLLLLTRGVAALPRHQDAHGLVDTVASGWEIFEAVAPRPVRELIRAVRDDFEILSLGLQTLPVTWLHGDLKLDNMGLDADGVLWLIDWALAVRAPACVELGWFIAANSHRLTVGPQEVLDLYTNAAIPEHHRERHVCMTALCGLLLRGWRKALDAQSRDRRQEFAWWCELTAEAGRFL